MPLQTIPNNVHVAGTLSAENMALPDETVGDDQVEAGANISADKLQHKHFTHYAQDSTTDAAVERKVLYVAKVAATLVRFAAGSVSPAAAAGNAVVDLLKNGVSVLSAAITLDSGNAAYALEDAAGFSSTALAAGDVLEFKLTSAAATTPKGVFCQLIVNENAV